MANKAMPWSNKEVEILTEKYPYLTKSELGKLFPYRSIKSITGKAEKLGLKKSGELAINSWSDEEVYKIKEHYSDNSKEYMLGILPNRTWYQIQSKASKLNIRKYSEYKEERRSWTVEEIKELVENRGYIFLGTFFDSFNKRKITVKCPMNIEQDVYFDNFKNGSAAGSLSVTRRKSYSEAIDVIQSEGYKVISDESNYINSKSEIETICPNGHTYFTNLSNFNNGNRCQKCWFEEIGKSNILPIEIVSERFLNNDYKIINMENVQYEGSFQVLECKCIHHEYEKSLYLTYEQVVHRNFKCPYCIRDERVSKYIEKYEDINNYFIKNNLSLITSKEEYVNNRLNTINAELKFICTDHKHYGEQIILNRSFRFNTSPCRYCVKKKVSGENSPHWKGGISNLAEYLRGRINKWKFDSMKSDGFKCILTDLKESLVVHHITPFSKIVQETMSLIELPVYENIGSYSEEDLENITNLCIDKHYEYGLGATLHSSIHDLFHEEYGLFYFDEDDFTEFTTRYKNGEFENFYNNKLNHNKEVDLIV